MDIPSWAFIVVPIAALALLCLFVFMWVTSLRVVVETNQVHIVQSKGSSTDYGRGRSTGNAYYRWPAWMPGIGVVVSVFPESIFPIPLRDYEAYDAGRLPFKIDAMAFFRVKDAPTAAQRVSSFEELSEQLENVVRGAVRAVLAGDTLENIMQDRSGLGAKFTDAVSEGLEEWGVTLVKQVEFMDIRDSDGSKVIANIMEKEKSRIDKDSRIQVATNRQEAEVKEIEAKQATDIRRQEAEAAVGMRTADREKEVGIALERSQQEVLEEARHTAEKQMEVNRVTETTQAEIAKAVAQTKAEQDRNVTTVKAEAERQRIILEAEASQKRVILEAEGARQAATADAEATRVKGEAIAEADRLKQMAVVTPQMEMAREIGNNPEYQNYLLKNEQIRANQEVGIAMAAAVAKAEIKVIANSIDGGVSSVQNLLGPAGGTALGGMLTAFGSTPEGAAVIDGITTKVADAVASKGKKTPA